MNTKIRLSVLILGVVVAVICIMATIPGKAHEPEIQLLNQDNNAEGSTINRFYLSPLYASPTHVDQSK